MYLVLKDCPKACYDATNRRCLPWQMHPYLLQPVIPLQIPEAYGCEDAFWHQPQKANRHECWMPCEQDSYAGDRTQDLRCTGVHVCSALCHKAKSQAYPALTPRIVAYWASKVFVLRQAWERGYTCHAKLTGWLKSWCKFVK